MLILLSPAFLQQVQAQEATSNDSVLSADFRVTDPKIELSQLKVLLRPLTIDELQKVAAAWQQILQDHVRKVGQKQLRIQESPDDAIDAAVKQELVDLRTQEHAIATRASLVLAGLKAKGGDTSQFEKYVAAVSDISGAVGSTSYWTAIKVDFLSWAKHEDGGKKYFRRILVAIAILFVFWIVSRVAGRASARMLARHQKASRLLQNFASRTVGGAVMFLGVLIGLAILGLPVTPMMAALGGGGFIIGFAMQETLGNFASGLLIMVYRPFDLHDYVSVAGAEGTVQEMSLVATTLLTADNKVLVIPNKKAWGQTIMNFTGRDTRRVDLTFKISYEDDIQKAIDVLLDIAQTHDLVLEEPRVDVHVTQLADSSVNLTCRPWVRTPDYWTVQQDLTHLVKDRFDTEKIGFPFPRRQVEDGDTTTRTDPRYS